MRGYTVEMSFLMPIIMLLVMSSIYAFFYYHDKNIIAGAAYETAVVGSNKAREKPDSQTGTGDRSGADVAELETLFQSRVNGKCILLSTIQGQVTVEGDGSLCPGTGNMEEDKSQCGKTCGNYRTGEKASGY